jgi:bacillithiol biosynthesis deacetylase BshB1
VSVDVLAIGAHPDDVEMTVGGTLAKMIDRGRSVAIVDMTCGEMGTRGTPETRAAEADAAAKVLGVSERVNLGLPDGMLQETQEGRKLLIEQIRRLRPSIVLAPYVEDMHPDHAATGKMVHGVMYPVGFAKYPAEGEPFRPREFLYYMSHFTFEPSFIVDISDHHERKIESVKCYSSQFEANRDDDKGQTWIGEPGFLKILEGRARHFGSLIHKTYGEPLLAPRAIPMDDPVAHYEPFFKV